MDWVGLRNCLSTRHMGPSSLPRALIAVHLDRIYGQLSLRRAVGSGEAGIQTCCTRTLFPLSRDGTTSTLDSFPPPGLIMRERSARVSDSSFSALFTWVERWIAKSREKVRAPRPSENAGIVSGNKGHACFVLVRCFLLARIYLFHIGVAHTIHI